MRESLAFIISVAIISTLLLLASFVDSASSGAAGLTPQGKGGEVVAKPTPTPKKPAPKKSTAKTSRANGSRSGSASTDEIAFWTSIKDSIDPEDFNAYLKQYPKGKFVTLAKNRLKTLEGTNSSPKPSTTNPSPTNPNPTNSNSSNMPRMRTNQAGIEFMLILPGSFMMGSTNGSDEKPVHQVTIKYSFYMGRFEVTQAQWQSVMGNNPSSFKGDLAEPYIKLPVEHVSWDDAQEFIRKLNEMNDAYRYRLPSEAEWEYACRAGTTGDYAGTLNDMAWYAENSENRTHPVGQKQPNAWGLFDMHGNVWEWCEDWYHETYSGAPTDGSAWLSGGEHKYRVLRGGSWNYYARSAIRVYFPPDWRNDAYGFRVVAVARTP